MSSVCGVLRIVDRSHHLHLSFGIVGDDQLDGAEYCGNTPCRSVQVFAYSMFEQRYVNDAVVFRITDQMDGDFDTLVNVAACEGYIEPEEKKKLLKFKNNPSDESWMK